MNGVASRLRQDVSIPSDDLCQAHVGTTPSQRLEILVEDVYGTIHICIYFQSTFVAEV